MVEYNSPISQSGLLFYNTLYDENASCHLAFGKGFPSSLKGLSATDYEAWKKVNLNFSSIHVDFMFGSEDMKITAKSRLTDEIIVFSGGNFVTL
ncbi:Aminopeptidase 2 [bioreactor metagenome]|uniref:Aminopeptidase 2 n=1 Tax=bioreactor metagenome TaxID=1076179 RepID=A0A645IRE4_9ZZZZ